MYLNYVYDSFKEISNILRYKETKELSKIVDVNSSSDKVNYLDKESNKLIVNSLSNYHNIVGYVSEEHSNMVFFNDKISNLKDSDKKYLLLFDPLDGSKNVEVNVTVGTIYSLIEYDLNDKKIKKIIESGYCLYGPSCILVKTNKNNVESYHLNNKNEFILVNEKIDNIKKNKLYCINQSKTFELEIKKIMQYLNGQKYNTRWVGSMVADCHMVISNGGLFMYPRSLDSYNGKLRLFYEVLPFAHIFSLLDGIALDDSYESILDKIYSTELDDKNIHRKTPIILCSNQEHKNLLELKDSVDSLDC